MPDVQKSLHSKVPSVDSILRLEPVIVLIESYGRSLVTDSIRAVITNIRNQISELAEQALPVLEEASIVEQLSLFLDRATQPSLRAVYNLTGTVLHTNLGRAVLAEEAIEAMVKVAKGASNLEYEIDSGKRGDRDSHLDKLLCELTGAEAATVVNNNAAAVLLVLNTLGQRKEVPVSRGELIEIGGAFRIPDIMKRAGCKLVEIGTTNRTHLKDYAEAISGKTACLMKVHTSNYSVQGFTKEVTAQEISVLARDRNLPLIEDLGSGTLIDLSQFGLPHEPTAQEAITSGVDVVTFSGDKLLGGPQAGLIVGRKDLIAKIKKNPMKRAMRLDKVTIAALTATLQLYLDPDSLAARVPTIRMLARSIGDIQLVAEQVRDPIAAAVGDAFAASIIDCQSQVGSGSLPVERLPSKALAIGTTKGKPGGKLQKLADAFRALPTPVIGRIQDDAFLLDLRCLEDVDGFAAQLGDLKL